MGLAAITAYRLGFLRSETWKDLRAYALARAGAKCFICGKEDFYNDVHHVCYGAHGKNVHNTLRVLCRSCHTRMHDELRKLPKVGKKHQAFEYFRKISEMIANDLGQKRPFGIHSPVWWKEHGPEFNKDQVVVLIDGAISLLSKSVESNQKLARVLNNLGLPNTNNDNELEACIRRAVSLLNDKRDSVGRLYTQRALDKLAECANVASVPRQ